MAIDSKDKRFSMMNFGSVYPYKIFINPDGSVIKSDRVHLLGLYGPVISITEEAALTLAIQGAISSINIGTFETTFSQALNVAQSQIANSIVNSIYSDGTTLTFVTVASVEAGGEFESVISIGSTLGLSQSAIVEFDATLTETTTFSDAFTNIATMGGDFSQEVDASISVSGGLLLESALVLGLSKSISQIASVSIESALDIALTSSITQSVIATLEPSISLDVNKAIVETVLANLNAELEQNTNLDYIGSAGYIVNEDLSLGVDVEITSSTIALEFQIETPGKRVMVVLDKDRKISIIKEDRKVSIIKKDNEISVLKRTMDSIE